MLRLSTLYLLSALLQTLEATGKIAAPDYLKPVKNFEIESYLGQWYEIARLDHPFERGLEAVTATYSLQKDGSIKVLNRGLKASAQKKWQEAVGRAEFVSEPDTGLLKVSFFGPFYGAYVIFELGENYEYAFVGGGDHSYLWLLARTPRISDQLKQRFVETAKKLGYESEELIFVKHAP